MFEIPFCMIVFFGLAIAFFIYIFLRQENFGSAPNSSRVKYFSTLKNFQSGKFQNQQFTPQLAEGHNMIGVFYKFIFTKKVRRKPIGNIPVIKTDLFQLDRSKNILVWFGHSSYYIQIDGKRILVDPVFSDNASPVVNTNKPFKGTDIYKAKDFPDVDILFITHDHYDHLDYYTILELIPSISKVITTLGVGSHLEKWGFPSSIIHEMNWDEQMNIGEGFIVNCEPARHFSGRGFTRNNTLWASFLLQTPTMKIYLGGDSGYGTHFKFIGEKYGSIDLAILDNGQFDPAWQYIHSLPHEVLKEAKELHAKRILPAHSSKFAMANHEWDAPLKKITELNQTENIPLITPKIGEVVDLNDNHQVFEKWWENVE